MTAVTEDTPDDQSLQYGCRTWRPSCLQYLNKAAWVVTFFSLGNCIQSLAVNGLMGTSLSNLEKRYNFSSFQSSWIVSVYDVATVPCLVLISFFGAKGHRPFWVALGLVVKGCGSLLFTLPHFIGGNYEYGQALRDNLCFGNTTECVTSVSSSGSISGSDSISGSGGYLAVFILARILHGIGATPIYTLGVTFMDDVTTKSGSSLAISKYT